MPTNGIVKEELMKEEIDKHMAVIEEKFQLLNREIAKIKQHLARIDKELNK